MTERTCGECHRCCVAFGLRELKKHQDQACCHLDGRNLTAHCTIYADRAKACREYVCLWRDGLFNDEDRPDKSGVIAHCDRLPKGQAQLVLTLDKDANYETMQRIDERFAGVGIVQILYRTSDTYHLMIQGRDGIGINGTYMPVDYKGLRFVQYNRVGLTEHAPPDRLIVKSTNLGMEVRGIARHS